MNIVRENFSNVPDKCLGCPALFSMASEIDFALGTSAAAVTQSFDADNPTTYDASQILATELALIAKEKMDSYQGRAEELWGRCNTGTISLQGRNRIGKKVGSTACGSSSKLPEDHKGSWKDL